MIAVFTNDAEISQVIRQAWIIFNVFVVFDTTQGVAASAIRASGLQKLGAIITGLAYFAIGIPVTCLLVFKADLGIVGIWVGPTLACALNTLAYLILFAKMDWPKLIQKSAN